MAIPLSINLKDSLNTHADATGGGLWGAPVTVDTGGGLSNQIVVAVVSSIIAMIALRMISRKRRRLMGFGILGGGSSSHSDTTYNQTTQTLSGASSLANGAGASVINSGGAPAINLGGANISAPITFSDYGSVQGALTLAQHVADQAQAGAAASNAALADQASGGANQNQRTLILVGVIAVAGMVLLKLVGKG